jgi:quinol monooxygenase YgiN
MLVQVVTFNLDGMSDADFRAACERDWAGVVATMPGLVSKSWLANTEANTYGGIYVWQDEAAMQHYADTDFFKAFASDPRIANISSQTFGVLEAPSRMTHGIGLLAA